MQGPQQFGTILFESEFQFENMAETTDLFYKDELRLYPLRLLNLFPAIYQYSSSFLSYLSEGIFNSL